MIFFASFASGMQVAHAISCLEPDRENALKNAEFIFQGKVVGSDPSQKTNLMKKPLIAEVKYSIEVQKIWRGKIDSPMIVYGGGVFGYVLGEGDTYIFLLRSNEKGLLKLGTTCDPTVLNLDEGEVLLQKKFFSKSWWTGASVIFLGLIGYWLFFVRKEKLRK